MYADNTSLDMNELNKYIQWKLTFNVSIPGLNKLTLNISKTEYMLIT